MQAWHRGGADKTFRRTLFRIIDSCDKRPFGPIGVKGNIFLLMQIRYYQRRAVIHYLANAGLHSSFKNKLELLIHSFSVNVLNAKPN